MNADTDDDRRSLNHDIRNQLSNIIMTVTELKYVGNGNDDNEVRNSLYGTIEDCCRNIERLLNKGIS